MPRQETVYAYYWSMCKKGWFRYPCRKTRKVTKWCYQFDTLKMTCFGVFARCMGKEDNIWYKWHERCFNLFGTKWYYNVRKCFDDPRDKA